MEPSSAEIKILHVLIDNPGEIPRVSTLMMPEWFVNKETVGIYNTILDMQKRNDTVLFSTVEVHLGSALPQAWQRVVADATPLPALDFLIEALRNDYIKRSTLDFTTKVASNIRTYAEYGGAEIIRDLGIFQKEMVEQNQTDPLVTVGESFDAFRDDLSMSINSGKVPGLIPPLASLQDLLGGFTPGQMICIAGRPSHGKSALLAETMLEFVINQKARGVLFSLEMNETLVKTRYLSRLMNINLHNLITRKVGRDELRRLYEPLFCKSCGSINVMMDNFDLINNNITSICQDCNSRNAELRSDIMKKINIVIDDRGSLTTNGLLHAVSSYKARYPDLSFVGVDYIGLMKLPQGQSRNDALGDVCRELHEMGANQKLVIFVLAQLNRENERRTDRRPILSDLRDSGEIENHMDDVIFVHYDFKYTHREEEKNNMELIVAKQRNGPTGVVSCGVDMRYQKFFDLGGQNEG
jgi:replicative DNA helicase